MEKYRKISVVISLLFSILFFAIVFNNFETINQYINNFTPDGNLESFDEKLHAILRDVSIGGLVVTLVWGLGSLMFVELSKTMFIKSVNLVGVLYVKFWKDAKEFILGFVKIFPRGKSFWLLLLFALIGGYFRILIIDRPMTHDETYSYLAFASQGIRVITSDYHLPNNHIFHSLLIWLSTEAFGSEPWAIRLPVFLVGLSLLFFAYISIKIYFKDESVALFLAGVVALHPEMIRMSTEARGYSVIALISLVMWGLSTFLSKNNNLFGWVLFVILGTVGFYSIPTMLYAYGMFLLWLLFLWFRGGISDTYEKNEFLYYFFGSGLGVVILTNLLYVPIYYKIGFNQFLDNMVVQEMQSKTFGIYLEQFWSRIIGLSIRWNDGALAVISLILLFGFVYSLLNYKTIFATPPFVFSASVWLLAVLSIQRNVPWPRVWFFLLPIYLTYCCIGILYFIRKYLANVKYSNVFIPGLLILFLFSTTSWILSDSHLMATWRGVPGDVEKGVVFLKTTIKENDVIVVTSPDGPATRYYTLENGLPFDHFELNKENIDKAYIVINTDHAQTPGFVIEKRGSIGEVLDLTTEEIVFEHNSITIYSIDIK